MKNKDLIEKIAGAIYLKAKEISDYGMDQGDADDLAEAAFSVMQSEQKSMDSAPKDGTEILIWAEYRDENGSYYICRWFQEEWVTIANIRLDCDNSDPSDTVTPKYWMHLSTPKGE